MRYHLHVYPTYERTKLAFREACEVLRSFGQISYAAMDVTVGNDAVMFRSLNGVYELRALQGCVFETLTNHGADPDLVRRLAPRVRPTLEPT